MRKLVLLVIIFTLIMTTTQISASNNKDLCLLDKDSIDEVALYITHVLSGREYSKEKDNGEYKIIKWPEDSIINIVTSKINDLPPYLFLTEKEILAELQYNIEFWQEATGLNIALSQRQKGWDVEVLGINELMLHKKDIQLLEDRKKKIFGQYNILQESRKQSDNSKQTKGSTCDFIVAYDDSYKIKQATIHIYSGVLGGGPLDFVATYNITSEELKICVSEDFSWIFGLQTGERSQKNIAGINITAEMLLRYLYDPRIKSGMSESESRPIIEAKLIEELAKQTQCGK